MEGRLQKKSNATTSTDKKRADLQGLRGVAILFVLVMHLNPDLHHLGFIGVDIFFVISGFLMTKILLEKRITLQSVCTFYIRRFKRIVPLYMLLAVAVYMYGYVRVLRFDRKQIIDDLLWVYTYSSNLQPIFQKLGYWDQLSTYRFFVHTWSLGVELQYYLIVPLIMGIASRCKHNIRLIMFLFLGTFSIVFQLCTPSKVDALLAFFLFHVFKKTQHRTRLIVSGLLYFSHLWLLAISGINFISLSEEQRSYASTSIKKRNALVLEMKITYSKPLLHMQALSRTP